MRTRSSWRQVAAGAALVAAGAFLSASVSVGSARALANKQRIAIEEKSTLGTHGGTFRLIPLTPGPVKADSGTFTYTAQPLPTAIRNGQRVARYTGTDTLTGKRGTLYISNTTASTDAGGGYSVGTGTWSVGGATGAYVGLNGRGRAAAVGTPGGLTISRYEGYVTTH